MVKFQCFWCSLEIALSQSPNDRTTRYGLGHYDRTKCLITKGSDSQERNLVENPPVGRCWGMQPDVLVFGGRTRANSKFSYFRVKTKAPAYHALPLAAGD